MEVLFCTCVETRKESTHDEVVASRAKYHGREVALMTSFEIITIVLGIVDTLLALGSFVVALLTWFRKETESRNKNASLVSPRERRFLKKN